jgi:hypothetical protein
MASAANVSPEFSEDVIEWLAAHLDGDTTYQLITDHPWAKTFRLKTEEATYYLKKLPETQWSSLPAVSSLAEHFSDHIPAIISILPSHGFMLSKDHESEPAFEAKQDNLDVRILQTYAKIQSQASTRSNLLALLPNFASENYIENLIHFFSDTSTVAGYVKGDHFLIPEEARKYEQRLKLRLPVLRELVQRACDLLPNTVNHGDLRHKNVAIRSDGTIILFDWDDAIAGPAGLSLHNYFSGCSRPVAHLLGLSTASALTAEQKLLLEAYMTELARQGYASEESLTLGLPGALCLGVMAYVLSYAKFRVESHEDREVIAKIIKRRTDDLLSLCDELSLSQRDMAIEFSKDHLRRGDDSEAQRLLQRYLASYPQDPEMRFLNAKSFYDQNEISKAIQQCRIGLEQHPLHADLRRLLGDCALENLEFDSVIDHWTLALKESPNHKELSESLCEIQGLRADLKSSDAPGAVPVIRLSETTLRDKTLFRIKVRVACRLFKEYGTLVVENAFSRELLEQLHSSFLAKYDSVLRGKEFSNALKVGPDRYMMTLAIENQLNSPEVFHHRFLQSMFRRLLGHDYVLGSFTAVASLAGAPDMRVHKDHPSLFPDDSVSSHLPTFAITVLLPLLGMTTEMGTTRVIKGSHRKSSEDSTSLPHQDPLAAAGSCLLMDYRLTHQGLANRSKQVRPVFSMVYNRPWFRDAVNYRKQPPLSISADEFARVPAEHQHLFQWFLGNPVPAQG